MNDTKRKKLAAAGWKTGSTAEFLELSSEESAYIDMRLKLADALRQRRKKRHLTQIQAAKLLQSSQSRIAKMEAGDPTVSLDLLVKSHLALGSSPEDLGKIISSELESA
ncbi:MAG: DNA-binding XRE family transcriptional regulator [Planctomycetota bacterium]|jgi:DNA-binding XRE family transcriptional regulator